MLPGPDTGNTGNWLSRPHANWYLIHWQEILRYSHAKAAPISLFRAASRVRPLISLRLSFSGKWSGDLTVFAPRHRRKAKK